MEKNKISELNSLTLFPTDNDNLKNIPKQVPNIFTKKINNGSALIPFNKLNNYVGKKQELLSFSKEWKYSLYFYNNNISKNLPSDSININNLIKSYFRMHLYHLVSSDFYRSHKIIVRSLNKVHVARTDIKHTNSKAIFTIYTYNREKLALLKNVQGKNMVKFIKNLLKAMNIHLHLLNKLSNNKWNFNVDKIIKLIYTAQLSLIRRYKYRLNFNQYKFEKKFLDRLAKFLHKFYKKNIEFNIVNLKSITFNTDIFTRIALLKTKKKQANIYRIMFYILLIAKIPKINKIYDKSRKLRSVNFNIIDNQFLNYNLNYIIKKKLDIQNNFLHVKENLPSITELYKIIFDSINLKKVGGIKLSIKGRLTKRYRADRAVYRIQSRGGFRNLDSSYKGLSVARKRGYLNPGVEYSILAGKRRVGAFAVKGWSNNK